MKIQELYNQDITRRINPAVVVSEMDKESIRQEIEEYVFTPSLTKYIYEFLNVIANKKEGKTGVWINGYYGSGKSHFIKYLFYCLKPEHRATAFQNLVESIDDLDDPLSEITESNAKLLNKTLNNYEFSEILFNIDAVTKKDDAKNRLTRVLLNQLNRIKGYNSSNIGVALYLEKVLDKRGLLQEFKDKILDKIGAEWTDANISTFVNAHLSTVLQVAKDTYEEIDTDSLKSAIKSKDLDFTIEYLISELQEHLATQKGSYKLVFLMDEMSQYIGDNTDLLLNLQTIVEEVGSKVGDRVWIVCTAQQDLSNLITNTNKKGEDFGKIMARFETRISLESQSAAYITKKRVLDKNSKGAAELQGFYKMHKGDIDNQFILDHDLYPNYSDRDDFILTYPFVPYQFQLISDVFQSFSQIGYVGEGVKNTERAILGITHFTAGLCKEEELGYFVPFDQFFNESMDKNLHQRARNILSRSYTIAEVKEDPFARRVVHALFMISSLSGSLKKNMEATAENLSILLLTDVSQSKKAIKDDVLRILNVLVDKNIVQETNGKFRFLKEDEIEIENEIKNVSLTLEDKYTYFYDSIIKKIAPPPLSVSLDGNAFKIGYSVDEKNFISNADIQVKFTMLDNRPINELASLVPANQLTIALHSWFASDENLRKKFDEYAKVVKYVSKNSSGGDDNKRKILNERSDKNNELLRDIQKIVKGEFMRTACISKNHVVEAKELGGTSPESLLGSMLDHHLKAVYKHLGLSSSYAKTNDDLRLKARDTQVPLKEPTPAEIELESKINLLGTDCNVGDLVKKMKEAPFGWKDIATLDVLLQLARKGKRQFEWKREPISLEEYVGYGLNSRERDSLTIHTAKKHSAEEVNNFKNGVNQLFVGKTVIPNAVQDYKEAVKTFRDYLNKEAIKPVNRLRGETESYAFSRAIKEYYQSLADLAQTRQDEDLVNLFHSIETKLSDQRDAYAQAEEFVDQNLTDFDKIKLFVDQNSANFEALDEVLQVQGADLADYIKTDSQPWETFPSMKKSYKEISDALKKQLKEKRDVVVALYTSLFEEIEAEKTRLKVEEANLVADKDHWLNRIAKEKSISQLEILEFKAPDLRTDSFKTLADYVARKKAEKEGKDYKVSTPISIAAEMKPREIKTPDELDDYINDLRNKLMVKLKKNQKIYLS